MSATILVLDNDLYMRELLSLHLCGAGYEVLVAEDAIVAGPLLLERRIDLLIADIEMPFMDGLDLVQAMRKDPAVSSMPVIFVTAHAEHERRARALGAVGFLTKPVRSDELLAMVAKHVRQA
ncbi:MAG TPA: response regulator [Methyloceanibacter sp.]|nr:response regulator [Methyloceanibacter sp.]